METLNQYSGLCSLLAVIVGIVSIIINIIYAKRSSRQAERYHRDWDKKRKYSTTYDANSEIRDNYFQLKNKRL